MSSPGQQGGQQGGAGSGSQSSPNQVSTTTSAQHTTSTAASSFNSPTSTSSSSGNQKSAIIGGIIGGVAGLLIISLIGIWLLQRRKKRQNGADARTTRPVTYTGLNSVFRGDLFNRSSGHSTQNSLLPQAQLAHGATASRPGATLRGGAGSPILRDSGNELDHLPPSYAESQLSTSMASLGLLNTSHRANSDTSVSPLSSRVPGDAHTISPQTTGTTFMSLQRLWGPNDTHMVSPQSTGGAVMVPQHMDSGGAHMISPQSTGATIPPLFPQHTRDTMGFPIDETVEGIRIQTENPAPIVAPTPRHPLVHQDSLERVVRQGLMPSESPVPSATNPNRLRVSSQEIVRESPILGGMNPVRMMPQDYNGVGRNDTQRTVSTVSSMGVSVVSDGELERLGVGSKARYHRSGGLGRS